MKKIAASILIGILFTSSIVSYSKNLENELADGIVRLHIVADSNEKRDQEVKLKIRDEILKEMDKFTNEQEIKNNITFFEETANRVLKENGFDYTAKAEFGVFPFPTKYYDGFALPKGDYRAIRVVLGKGEGENWWCVMFPPLCMVDAATEEQSELLKQTFGENYPVVAEGGKVKFKIRFKLAEIF